MAAMALIFKMMMCPSGILNHLLELIGLPPYRWLSSPDTALTSVALLSIWKSLGGNIVILTAGLLAIPNEIYDAAKVDGAGGWKLFRRVTLPLLTPSLKLVVTLTIIGSLQAYTSAVVLTNGGPVNSTLMISQFITSEAFDNMRFGVASASAFLLFLVIFSVTMVQLRIMKTKWEY
jgi:ABC-type sugar transport system permease subunit